jgi:glycosyltransferase involved in cell wall biosynthesis
MRILITTGITFSEIGGPAKYVKNLAKELEKLGFKVKILSYNLEKRLPLGMRHFVYFLRTFFYSIFVDLIIGLDIFSTGFPAVLASKILKKKIILRVGGDFLWETYIERTGNLITLEKFYGNQPNLPLKHKIIAFLQKWTLKNASALVFNTSWQKNLFTKIYNLNPKKTFVIENFYPSKVKKVKDIKSDIKEKVFLFAGRKIKFKNLKLIEKIFEELKKEGKDIKLEIVDNLSHDDLQEKIKKSYALIVPSISDFAPNFIIEGLAFDKPFILTKNCGLIEKFKDVGIFIDPFDIEDIKNKILFLSDEKNYKEYQKRIENFNFTHSWEEIVKEFIEIYRKIEK